MTIEHPSICYSDWPMVTQYLGVSSRSMQKWMRLICGDRDCEVNGAFTCIKVVAMASVWALGFRLELPVWQCAGSDNELKWTQSDMRESAKGKKQERSNRNMLWTVQVMDHPIAVERDDCLDGGGVDVELHLLFLLLRSLSFTTLSGCIDHDILRNINQQSYRSLWIFIGSIITSVIALWKLPSHVCWDGAIVPKLRQRDSQSGAVN